MAQSSRQQIKVKVPAMRRVPREGRAGVLARLPSLRAPRDLTLSASSLVKPTLTTVTRSPSPDIKTEREVLDHSSDTLSDKPSLQAPRDLTLSATSTTDILTPTVMIVTPDIKTEREELDDSPSPWAPQDLTLSASSTTGLLKQTLTAVTRSTLTDIKTEREELDDSFETHPYQTSPMTVARSTSPIIKTEREELDDSFETHSDPSLWAPQDLAFSACSLSTPALMTVTRSPSPDIKTEREEVHDSSETHSDTPSSDHNENAKEGDEAGRKNDDFLLATDSLLGGRTAGPSLKRGAPGSTSGLIGGCNGVWWQEAAGLDSRIISSQDKQKQDAARWRRVLDDKKKQPATDNSSHRRDKFKCLECGREFNSMNRLTYHTHTHTGVRNYECRECGKRFITRNSLNSHFVTHTRERNYECKECGKLFFRKDHLNRHMLTHTGVKKYECQECGKKFCRKRQLDTHVLTHDSVRNYEC